ncbi:MAG TPA: hypothetical protein PKA33_14740 [Amaricoccus sp.]|uniref:hypothetical protein n=1 Tax=Amaricoccus sp. TaxID=1872485 RepID=UPI002C19EE97|nr:hypothetical protein [Amaricoccus sp.]HMQ93744.1 hypothetical protein [Amaricoccus sp.]HMR53596.1 hypothetical protein [Amaricoccus sp.]HMU00607.1 hypothetical protein [Amaricoccus sp.]
MERPPGREVGDDDQPFAPEALGGEGEDVPVTEAEIKVFERWFGDLFDDLFGSGG